MSNIYVIYGDNQFAINLKLKEIITQLKVEEIIKYDLSTTNINQIIIDASMISLFATQKIIVAENSYFLTGSKSEETSNSNNYDGLLKYINHPNPDTILVFIINSDSLDERKKIVKLLKEKAKIVKCFDLSEQGKISYATDRFHSNSYQINSADIKFLISRVGNNINILEQEIDKLMLYKLEEKTISKADIEILVPKQIEDDIFALINHLVNNDKPKSFEVYNHLITHGEEPIKIIVFLANQFRLIYQVKILTAEGISEKDIASHLKIHPYPVKLAKEKIHQFSLNQLKKYLEQLAELDYQIKNGLIDKYLGIELFFLKI